MSERPQDVLTRWWAAEREGREGEAEHALARLFAALPMPAPGQGFAERVLASVGLETAGSPVPALASARLRWWSRAAAVASLSTVGLALAYLVPLVLGLGRLVAPGDVVGAFIGAFVALVSQVDEALSIWRFVAAATETLALIVTAPPVILTLLTLSALSAFTFRGLHELLNPRAQRNPEYVQAR